MTRKGSLCTLLAISLAACDAEPSDPGGQTAFQVTSVQPAAGATDVAWTTTFEASLSAALDPATLTADAVALRRQGVQVPAVLSWNASSRTIRIVAPLVPGATYEAELGSGLRSLDGEPLEGHRWSASTRAWTPTVLSGTGELDGFGLALGPSGDVHLFGNGEYRPYSDYQEQYMKYVACSSNCSDPASWGRMAVDSAYLPYSYGTVVVNPSGRVHLLYLAEIPRMPDWELRYGTCASDCLSAGNWTLATVALNRDITGFAQDASGGLHLVSRDLGYVSPDNWYTTCQADCADSTNWAAHTALPVIGYEAEAPTALQVDHRGGVHLLTFFSTGLSYTYCRSDCLSAAEWSSILVPGAEDFAAYPSFAVDPGGGVHLLFLNREGDYPLTYARCPSDCTDPSAWQRVELAGDQSLQTTAITVDETGRIFALVGFSDPGEAGELRFMSCVADCLNTASWQSASVSRLEVSDRFTGAPRLTFDAAGRLRMVYGNGGVTPAYLE